MNDAPPNPNSEHGQIVIYLGAVLSLPIIILGIYQDKTAVCLLGVGMLLEAILFQLVLIARLLKRGE